MDITEYMEGVVKLQKNNYRKSNIPYVSTDDFVLQNGQIHIPQKFDFTKFEGIPSTPRECFRNAWYLAESYDLIYVEGMAHGVFPTLHAWCIDSNLNVYDPTWKNPEESMYYGVRFNDEYINKKMLETGFFGVIDNTIQNYPLLTGVDKDFAWVECMKP